MFFIESSSTSSDEYKLSTPTSRWAQTVLLYLYFILAACAEPELLTNGASIANVNATNVSATNAVVANSDLKAINGSVANTDLLTIASALSPAEPDYVNVASATLNASAPGAAPIISASPSQISLSAASPIVATVAIKSAIVTPVDPPGLTQTPIKNPILFVTQVPTQTDFASRLSTFGNHVGGIFNAPRGGDLMIRYPDGTIRNLTKEAGFGSDGLQGANAIAVREPTVHWDGKKALFSMVVGAPTTQYQVRTDFWQIYEVSGLSKGEAVAIRPIPNQPKNFNNISPIYGTDEQILFTSDRPRNGAIHLYPQLDEYESTPTVTGIWKLNSNSGNLRLLNHAVSGAFSPTIDSFGRILYTRWDHLQRDQQVDLERSSPGSYKPVDFTDEGPNSTKISLQKEMFPELRYEHTTSYGRVTGHLYNLFSPWTMNEDGTEEETLNHFGRQEFAFNFLPQSFMDDPALKAQPLLGLSANTRLLPNDGGLFQLKEDPRSPGKFFAIYTKEFKSLSSGQIVRINGGPSVNASQTIIEAFTKVDAFQSLTVGGRFRNPLPTTDGQMIAAYTPTDDLTDFRSVNMRLRQLKLSADKTTYVPGDYLNGDGIKKTITWWSPDQQLTFSGALWEVEPVEVVARVRPKGNIETTPAQEKSIFQEEGIEESSFKAWMESNGVALIITRNQTSRDKSDLQQPFNLRVPGGITNTSQSGGKVYDISNFQLIQAEQLRGYNSGGGGRRPIGRPVPVDSLFNPPNAGGPVGSVKIAPDGSTAAFVPANRAMAWQTVDPAGEPVVRERVWVTFQPGEVRVCGSCHGVNKVDQAGKPAPENKPEALRTLLKYWKTLPK
jgi:hypothetical protein